jgi:hypothetical protein
MNKGMIGITLALALIGGVASANGTTGQGSDPRSYGNASAPAARLDACPYYPSAVACRVGSTDRAGS